jgi:hypothetical protein
MTRAARRTERSVSVRDLPRTRVPHISLVFREMWGATVGRPFTTWTNLAKNERDTPDFLHAAPDKTTCAPFFKERRMKILNPIADPGWIRQITYTML